MINQQTWQTEEYKGMDVHVTALARGGTTSRWDFAVRVTDPGVDSSATNALAAGSGNDEDYATEEDAVQAEFSKGYGLVDELKR